MFPSAQRRKIGHLVDNGKTITLYGVEKNQPKITLLLWKTVVKKKTTLRRCTSLTVVKPWEGQLPARLP